MWGVAHQFGRAAASLAGGALVDGMRLVTGDNDLASYGAAFALEAVVLVVAYVLIGRLDISASFAVAEEQAEAAPQAVIEESAPVTND